MLAVVPSVSRSIAAWFSVFYVKIQYSVVVSDAHCWSGTDRCPTLTALIFMHSTGKTNKQT